LLAIRIRNRNVVNIFEHAAEKDISALEGGNKQRVEKLA
jgi:hypothetical protein